ncbi:hypothetical protein Hanom_Chr17g01531791 [Helianthus anomalus]
MIPAIRSEMTTAMAENEKKEEVKGGELLFCGVTEWAAVRVHRSLTWFLQRGSGHSSALIFVMLQLVVRLYIVLHRMLMDVAFLGDAMFGSHSGSDKDVI